MKPQDVTIFDCVVNQSAYIKSIFETPYLFFDLDGTVRYTVDNTNGKKVSKGYGSTYGSVPANSVEEVKTFECIPEKLKQWKKRGYKIIGITNQSGIQYGYMTIERCKEVLEETIKQLEINIPIIFAPLKTSKNIEVVNLRKPNIGMFKLAESLYGKVYKEKSFMVGDYKTDIEAAEKFGISAIKVDSKNIGNDFPVPK